MVALRPVRATALSESGGAALEREASADVRLIVEEAGKEETSLVVCAGE